MEEIWRDVVGYEGLYQVSNYGRIRRITILKNDVHPIGYEQVHLSKNGKAKTHKVHRVVAQAFLDNQNQLPEVNHKDENKTNNFIWVNPDGSVDPDKSNLEWCTHKYNLDYGTRTIRHAQKTSVPVVQMLDGVVIKIWKSAKEAEQAGVVPHGSMITKVCKKKAKTCYGFQWIYLKDFEGNQE